MAHPLPFPRSQMREIILETAGASGQREAAVRYWASVGPGALAWHRANASAAPFM